MSKDHENTLKHEVKQAIKKYEDNMVNADRDKSKNQAFKDARVIIANEVISAHIIEVKEN